MGRYVMELHVVVEQVEGNGYLARTPLGWSAEGPTPEQAVKNLQEEAARKLAGGATVTTIQVPTPDTRFIRAPDPGLDPWKAMIGTLDLNDPVIREWMQIIEENRRAADNDPDVF
jgi:hypothetical protein